MVKDGDADNRPPPPPFDVDEEEEEEDGEKFEHRFSVALSVAKASDIFSSSKVITAFCGKNENDGGEN